MLGVPVRAAELFALDRDPLSSDYTGPTGPLVMSGDIVPGDYDRLLARIEQHSQQFLATNRLILAADEGDVTEAIRIGDLIKSLLTQVEVGPLTGPCSGPCFLIYAAAARRGTDGSGLLGLYAPASSDEQAHRQVVDYLAANQVPSDLVEHLVGHDREDPYWLSGPEEEVLGARSAAFEQQLARRCGWSADLERAVYAGERPMEELKSVWACTEHLVQPTARHALCLALAARDAARQKAASAPPDAATVKHTRKAHGRSAPRTVAKKSACNDPPG
jgi:hypothetical protein